MRATGYTTTTIKGSSPVCTGAAERDRLVRLATCARFKAIDALPRVFVLSMIDTGDNLRTSIGDARVRRAHRPIVRTSPPVDAPKTAAAVFTAHDAERV
jgi:hypothetical protein